MMQEFFHFFTPVYRTGLIWPGNPAADKYGLGYTGGEGISGVWNG